MPGEEQKYPGRIVINRKKKIVQLQIFGKSSIEGNDVTNGLNADPKHFLEYIVGSGEFAERITLYNCYLRKVDHFGKHFAKIVYEADKRKTLHKSIYMKGCENLVIET